ncbi:cadmium resistance transporter [Ligilactobacillus sp. WILCCON 0076]|uniref:Cadmium resistance transporter n=1 Tax=Ligilactobacillus ubinensis TaxID=2876789 RepID=A0A9X2JME1_9LACO|nr:cadmium resistance transporter [Ligilactobacillus ubinensis]MCP0887982.1 cadmium resistance transporter [Ligilactobacillus ubinensis]
MNYWILTLTFISVNLDFFFMLLFLLKKYTTVKVILGYLIGTIILLTLSYFVGQVLTIFLPEWILGTLGVLPIYLAFNDNDEESGVKNNKSQVVSVLVTYLSVCAGCNLSIFLPVLVGENLENFLLTVVFIGLLTVLVVMLIKLISELSIVSNVMEKYGEKLMKFCYIVIGFYVFWDSGLIKHLIALI